MLRDDKIPIGKRFNLFLSAVSFVSFLLIFLSAFFGVNLEIYSENVLMIILGLFLTNQGKVFLWGYYFKDRNMTQSEFLRIVIGIFGIIAVMVGVLAFFIPPSSAFTGMKGILAGIAVVMILIQSFITHK